MRMVPRPTPTPTPAAVPTGMPLFELLLSSGPFVRLGSAVLVVPDEVASAREESIVVVVDGESVEGVYKGIC